MAVLGNKIKDANEIQSSIKRIAYQVYESNFDEKNIVIVGIGSRGGSLSKLLGAAIEKISPLKLKKSPLRITLPHCPAPTAGNLEKIYYPTVETILPQVKKLLD